MRDPLQDLVDQLLEAIGRAARADPDVETAVTLIWALGSVGGPGDAALLAPLVESSDFRIRDAALRALALVDSGRAAGLAMRLLDSPLDYDRDAAADVLATAARPADRAALAGALERPDVQYRVHPTAPTIRERIERAIRRLDFMREHPSADDKATGP